jgi:hypothetical protein
LSGGFVFGLLHRFGRCGQDIGMIFFDELPLTTVGTTIKAKSYQIETPDMEGIRFGAVRADGAAEGTMNGGESRFLAIAVGNNVP